MTAVLPPALMEDNFSGLASGGVAVALTPVPPLERLEPVWRNLESRADGAFFTTWSWIGPWLAATAGGQRFLVTARVGAQVVALAVLTSGRRNEPWPRTIVSLNGQAGDPFYIEYNDVLVDRAWSGMAREAILAAVLDGGLMPCDDLEIAGAAPDATAAAAALGLPLDSRTRECPWVDFAKCQKNLEGYLAALSRNTRGQVRRALRLAAGSAGLSLYRSRTYAEKIAALNELRRLHQDSWRRRGQVGAFAAPGFNTFVSALLFMPGVELLHIGAGARTVGVLLNFVYRGEVYAYQSGFSYTDDNRLKPGLACHALAIAESMGLGRKGYHFMAGESRYKDQLATSAEALSWLTVSRPGPGTTVIRGLRSARSLARSWAAGWQ